MSRLVMVALSLVAVMCSEDAMAARYVVTSDMFKADSTGAADASFAIQNALNMAKGGGGQTEVFFPNGNYRIDNTLVVYSNTKLSLNDGARIFRSVNGPQVMLTAGHMKADGGVCPRDGSCTHGGYTQVCNISIEGGVWDGGDDKTVTGAMLLPHGKNIRVANATFRHFTEHVLNFSASSEITLKNLLFEDMYEYAGNSADFWSGYVTGDSRRFLSIEAIHLDVANVEGEPSTYPHDNTACKSVIVEDCRFMNGFAGIGNHHVISGVQSEDIMVKGCRFSSLSSYALHTHGFKTFLASSCQITNCLGLVWGRDCSFQAVSNLVAGVAGDGVLLMNGSSAFLKDNEICGTMLHGIHCENSSVETKGNRISTTGQCGIRAISCVPFIAMDNEIGSPSESGVSLENCKDSLVSSNVIDSANLSGVVVVGGLTVLQANAIKSSVCHGVVICESSTVELRDNDIMDSGQRGISVSGGSAILVGNTIKSSGAFSLCVENKANILVSGNRIRAPFETAVRLLNLDGVEFYDNVILGERGYGCLFSSLTRAKVVGNIVRDFASGGMLFATSDDCTVSSNHIESVFGEGLYYQNSTRGKIVGNEVRGTAGVAIRVAGTASADIIDNIAESNSASVRDISIEAAVDSSLVRGNTCRLGGVAFSSAALSAISYEPAEVAVEASRRSDGSVTLVWPPSPVAMGTGQYEVEYSSNCDFTDSSHEILPSDSRGWVIPADSSGITLYVRVRYVHIISGVRYVSPYGGDSGKSFRDIRIVFLPGSGGIGSMSDYYVNPELVSILPRCLFSNESRNFVAWRASNGRLYDDGVLIFQMAAPGQTVTMEAIWK